MTDPLSTPILFTIFNRPDTTKIVFEKIRQIQPKYLYIAADGPRNDDTQDIRLSNECRNIINQIDWDCELHTLFRNENLGCKMAISSAIDWFFENVELGIILEDDCVPDLSFFPFCGDLLNYYKDDKRVGLISGSNFYSDAIKNFYSYYFSKYSFIWGWATWKRTWELYDVNMKLWPEIQQRKYLNTILSDKRTVIYWNNIFDATFQNRINTWDHQLTFSMFIQNLVSIIPKVNLVSNIGFNSDATHTKKENNLSNFPVSHIDFPLKKPKYIIKDNNADIFFQKYVYGYPQTIFSRIVDRMH